MAAELDAVAQARALHGALGVGPASLVRPDQDETRRAVAEQRDRLDRRDGVLARLEGADEERIRLAVGARPVRAEHRVDAGRRDDDLLLGDAVELDQVALGQLGKRSGCAPRRGRLGARPAGR